MNRKSIYNLFDPVSRGLTQNECFLRTYQSDALRTIFDAVMAGKGGRFAVTFPRQSGKNETQAQLEAAVMAANLYRGGSIIKIIPTEKNQGRISTERLAGVLGCRVSDGGHRDPEFSGHGTAGSSPFTARCTPNAKHLKVRKDEISYGSTKVRCLSASPNAAIVGATADLMLEVDEAQMVSAEKFDLEAAPMAAAANAVQVFWGTAWDDRTLLARETRLARLDEEHESRNAECKTEEPHCSDSGETANDPHADRPLGPDEQHISENPPDSSTATALCTLNSEHLQTSKRCALHAELSKHVFTTTCVEVGKEVPEYGNFVRGQIEQLGREHPAIRTQFFCEEISDLTSMFTGERISRMKGEHEPLYAPEADRCYVFLIDVAGSDEIKPADRRANGFSDRRDATVVTICDVWLPEDKAYDPKNFVWKVVGRRLYRNLRTELLEKEICREIDFWNPNRIIIDHSGMGAMLSDILTGKYKTKVFPVDITAPNKTRMAWDFLSMVDTGRWVEYKGDEMNVLQSTFTPGTEPYELLREPELLQQMFFRELRACRIEPTGNALNVRWGVKEGTRDHATGRIIHDDLVMSAAMAVFESGNLPVCNVLPEWNPIPDPWYEEQKRRQRRKSWR